MPHRESHYTDLFLLVNSYFQLCFSQAFDPGLGLRLNLRTDYTGLGVVVNTFRNKFGVDCYSSMFTASIVNIISVLPPPSRCSDAVIRFFNAVDTGDSHSGVRKK